MASKCLLLIEGDLHLISTDHNRIGVGWIVIFLIEEINMRYLHSRSVEMHITLGKSAYTLHRTELHCIVLYCNVLYCTALHCTALYCIVLHCIVLHCIALYCIVLHCTALYCTALYCTVLYCTALYCAALHCTALHCAALHCTALYCAALHCTTLHCSKLNLIKLNCPASHMLLQVIVASYSGKILSFTAEPVLQRAQVHHRPTKLITISISLCLYLSPLCIASLLMYSTSFLSYHFNALSIKVQRQ